MKRLLLCAGPRNGPYSTDRWFRVDCDPRVEPDLVARVPPIPQELKDHGEWDTIALIHGIEHFAVWDVRRLLAELCPLLKVGGTLILEQPNIAVCSAHLDNPVYYNGIYGDPVGDRDDMLHKSGHTPESLAAEVVRAGFRDPVTGAPLFHHPERDFRLVATR